MSQITHPELVKALVKPGETIARELTGSDANLWHMASCIPGEAGELFDAVKKRVIYRKILDRDNVIEELGDLEFYLEGLRQELGITREECLQANIHKLSKRYMDLKYSNQAAQARADKDDGCGAIDGGGIGVGA
jgi:NTP pyrophosphatase (non-canonical NTP hydrolase)